MKPTLTLLSALLLWACNSTKQFSVGDDVSKNQYERLLKDFAKTPTDAALAENLKYAYGRRETEQLQAIARLQGQASARALEQLLNSYIRLNQFYDAARATATVDKLLTPGDVSRQITDTRLLAADAWYNEADQLLSDGSWQSARAAQDALNKVNRWYPNYKNTKSLLAVAADQAVVDAVIVPMRNEGFFGAGIYGNGFGNGFAQSLSAQLARDLGGRYGNPTRLRVWDGDAMGGGYNNPNPDVLVEPVWTRWQRDPESRRNYTRNVSKQLENGRDSAGRQQYKTVTATLRITEFTQQTQADFDLRIGDVASRRPMNNRTWREGYTISQSWATYTGDANALGPDEWELLRSPQSIMRPSDEWLQQKILEKIYPELLQYLRSQLQ